jgi:hypothetical protein
MTPTKLATIALGLAAFGLAYLFRADLKVAFSLVGFGGSLLGLSGPEVGKAK